MEVEGGEGQEEERARPGLQGGVARKVPGEEGQEEGPALPGGRVERGEGPGQRHLVKNPGEAVGHGPEAPGPVDLHFKAAEGAAQNLALDFPVDLGFPRRKKGSGGRLGFLTSNLSIPSSHRLAIPHGRPSTTLSNPLDWGLPR